MSKKASETPNKPLYIVGLGASAIGFCRASEKGCAHHVYDKNGKEYLLSVILYKMASDAYAGIVLPFFDLSLLASSSQPRKD